MADDADDLDLLAFRYVAGEMNPVEAAAWETRLEGDQAARQAVSHAVGLAQQLAAAAPPAVDPPVPSRKSAFVWAQPLAWMAIGAASAVLAVNLFSQPAAGPNVPGRATNAQPGGSSPVNALVWARLQSEQELTAAELERWLDEPATAEDAEDLPFAAEVPSWVSAARPPASRGVNP